MTVYIDIVFLENLFMNYIIVFASGIILKTQVQLMRYLLASVLGSTYAVISYMTMLGIYSNMGLKITLSILMVGIAFRPKRIRELGKQLIIFYLTSFTFGGVAFFLLYFVKPQEILFKNRITNRNVSHKNSFVWRNSRSHNYNYSI